MFKLKIRNILISTLLLFFLLITPTYAAKMETGEYTLDKESIVEDDLYVTGDNITISGIVDGDLIIIGENILIDGTITGDLYTFGTNIKVTGIVSGNTVALGSNVSISGTMRDNIYLAAIIGDINANVTGDILSASGQLSIDGSISDDIRVVTGQLTSTASVGGDFLIGSDNYTLDENDISGELIAGTKSTKTDEDVKLTKEDFLGFNLVLGLINFVGMYIVGTILILSAPVKTLKIEKKITSSWTDLLKSYAVGIVTIFAIPIPIFLLLLTLIGVPLAFLVIGILLFLSTFGIIWTESAIGHKILQLTKQRDYGRFISLLIGRSISVILKLIPIVRGLYSISLIAITIGSVIRMKYDGFAKSKEIGKKKSIKKN